MRSATAPTPLAQSTWDTRVNLIIYRGFAYLQYNMHIKSYLGEENGRGKSGFYCNINISGISTRDHIITQPGPLLDKPL